MLYSALNCWFCNHDSKVSIFSRNSWHCSHCGQYNGFTKDGDYNKRLPEMYASRPSPKYARALPKVGSSSSTKNSAHLCERCLLNQKIKIEKLANFVPSNEQNYHEEARLFKEELERVYDLCPICKSRVRFEIRQQDGILKQYLFKLGWFGHFFENTNKRFHTAEDETQERKPRQKRLRRPWTDSSVLSLAIYLGLFLVISFALVYNGHRFNKMTGFSLSNERYTWLRDPLESGIQLANDQIDRAKGLVLYLRDGLFGAFGNSDWAESAALKRSLLRAMNQWIPCSLIAAQVLSLVLVLIERRNKPWLPLLVSALVLVTILADLAEMSRVFRVRSNLKLVNFRCSLVLGPLVQVAVIAKLLGSLASRLMRPKEQEAINHYKKTDQLRPGAQVSSAPCSPFDQPGVNEALHPSPTPQINLNFKQDSYSMIKFLNHPAECTNRYAMSAFSAQSSYSSAPKAGQFSNSSSIIKPAKLEVSNQQLYKYRDSLSDISENSAGENTSNEKDEDSSSIISGLTNLYLHRQGNQQGLPPQFDPARSQKTLFNASVFSTPKSTGDDFSFYQSRDASVLDSYPLNQTYLTRDRAASMMFAAGKADPRRSFSCQLFS